MYDDIDLQSAFVHSILTQTLSDSFVDVSDMEARLEVYRRNFMQGHCNALHKTFAMTAQYLGDAFESLAISYVCQYRPKAGQLFATYGESFASFLQDPLAKGLARLEWDLQSILMLPVDECQMTVDPNQAYWQLRSDVRLFQRDYNVGEVYRTLKTTGGVGRVEQECFYYLLRCKDSVPIIQSVSQEEYLILELLKHPHLTDELFDKLTFSKEFIVNLLPKLFNPKFLKVRDDNSNYYSEMCSMV
ncbi:MAG: DNA-binding domain-containing protein [Alphaproteobacteria bacterium]|nr:DNA-binding domain-containing protein [Alphaproteobacteria bacterium]